MSEEYKVQITVSLPPSAQYAKGDMLNVRAQDADDLLATLTGLFDAEAASVIIGKFRSFAIAVPDAVGPEAAAAVLSKPASGGGNSWGAATGGYQRKTTSGGGGAGGKKISEKQVGFIQRIMAEKGLKVDTVLDLASQVTSKAFRPSAIEGLSSFEASKLIDLLREHAGNVA